MPGVIAPEQGAVHGLWPAPPARLFCILDCGLDAAFYPALRLLAAVTEIVSLYEGDAARELANVSPYLVALDEDSAAFDWLWSSEAHREAGLLITSAAGMEELRAHLRRLTRIRIEGGGTCLFRFYDPLVMGAFLRTCDDTQLRELFGPIDHMMMFAADGSLLSFRYADGHLHGAPVALAA